MLSRVVAGWVGGGGVVLYKGVGVGLGIGGGYDDVWLWVVVDGGGKWGIV